jgi:protein required for attachment to host cells
MRPRRLRPTTEIAMEKIVTWVVVADHQHGHAFENDGPSRGLNPVEGFSFDTRLHAGRDLVTERPPRGFSPAAGTPHAIEPKVDPHREEGERFVSDVAAALTKASDAGQFHRLLLIAPPRALGEFRKHLPHRVRDKLLAEIDEDLTRAARAQIEAHVAPFLAV